MGNGFLVVVTFMDWKPDVQNAVGLKVANIAGLKVGLYGLGVVE